MGECLVTEGKIGHRGVAGKASPPEWMHLLPLEIDAAAKPRVEGLGSPGLRRPPAAVTAPLARIGF